MFFFSYDSFKYTTGALHKFDASHGGERSFVVLLAENKSTVDSYTERYMRTLTNAQTFYKLTSGSYLYGAMYRFSDSCSQTCSDIVGAFSNEPSRIIAWPNIECDTPVLTGFFDNFVHAIAGSMVEADMTRRFFKLISIYHAELDRTALSSALRIYLQNPNIFLSLDRKTYLVNPYPRLLRGCGVQSQRETLRNINKFIGLLCREEYIHLQHVNQLTEIINGLYSSNTTSELSQRARTDS